MNFLIKFKDLVIGSLKDNMKLIIIFYIIFILSFIGAWFLSSGRVGDLVSTISSVNNTAVNTNMGVGAVELFINNEWGGILTYIGSVIFGIPAIVMLVYNGFSIGGLGPLFTTIIPNDGLKYIVYLIPHGIFEITATVLQSVAGVLLFIFIYRFIKALLNSEIHGFNQAFNVSRKALIDSVVLMIFATILLLIAAPIEAYFSVPFSNFIVGV